MSQQLHKRFTLEQVKNVFRQYEDKNQTVKSALRLLQIGRSRFFELYEKYLADKENFSLEYKRDSINRKISSEIETNIKKELEGQKQLLENKSIPISCYNYSYIKDQLFLKHQQKVSVPTIINRAKEQGFWLGKPQKKMHDREVLTNYAGELIQHDSSHHLFAPDTGMKWYLITSLDDFSRAILYGDLWERETTWSHISAMESLVLGFGIPQQYYVDQLRVFRYVKNRDSAYVNYQAFTDDVDPQWKQVAKDCGIEVIYALSAQAKGKIERPYRWLQDRLVRTCVSNGITKIEDARTILKEELRQYNWKRVHSTTKEIPMQRFQDAISNRQSLFRPFEIKPPFTSAKDIFCFRTTRIVDAYRKVSFKKISLTVPNGFPKQEVELRLHPIVEKNLVAVRFWRNGAFLGEQKVKNDALSELVQF